MKNLLQITALVALLLTSGLNANAQGWNSDVTHSSLVFQIRHIVTPFIGRFDRFDVSMKWDGENVENSSINASVDVTSVNTGNEDLNKHILSADFFDAENHPKWTFVSTKITKTGENEYLATGNISLRETTKEVSIPFKFLGAVDTEMGKKAGFQTEFTIVRTEFGLGDELGGGISDEVKVMFFLEMNGK